MKNTGFETIMVITITALLASLAFVFRLISVLAINYISFDYILLIIWAVYFRWYLNYALCNTYCALISLYYSGFGFVFVLFTFFAWNIIVTIIFSVKRAIIKYYFLYPILVFILIYLQYFIAIFLYNWIVFNNIKQAFGFWVAWLINNTICAITTTILTSLILIPFIKMIYYFTTKYPFLFNKTFIKFVEKNNYIFNIKIAKKTLINYQCNLFLTWNLIQ